jgi:hypothetical protein
VIAVVGPLDEIAGLDGLAGLGAER